MTFANFEHRVLKDNPELYQLYKDLVVSGVITAEEFWANRTKVTMRYVIMSQSLALELCSANVNLWLESYNESKVLCPRTQHYDHT